MCVRVVGNRIERLGGRPAREGNANGKVALVQAGHRAPRRPKPRLGTGLPLGELVHGSWHHHRRQGADGGVRDSGVRGPGSSWLWGAPGERATSFPPLVAKAMRSGWSTSTTWPASRQFPPRRWAGPAARELASRRTVGGVRGLPYLTHAEGAHADQRATAPRLHGHHQDPRYNALRLGLAYASRGVASYEERYRRRVLVNVRRRAQHPGFILMAAPTSPGWVS
jgi:hypothetical protein